MNIQSFFVEIGKKEYTRDTSNICWYIYMSPKNEPSIFVLEIGKKKKHQTDIKTSILWIDLGLYPHTISQQTLVKIYWDLKSNMSESLADEFYSRQFRYHKWNWKFGIYPTLWWSFFYSTKIVCHLYTFALPSLYFPSDKGRQYFPKFYAPFINICQGCQRFETSVFFSEKINISTTGGSRVGFFQPDTNHP